MAAMGHHLDHHVLRHHPLALIAEVHVAENTCDLVGFPGDCASDPQRTVIAQLAASVFGGANSIMFFYMQAATAAILILAANTTSTEAD